MAASAPVRHHLKGVAEGRHRDDVDLVAEALNHLLEDTLLDGALKNGDSLAVELGYPVRLDTGCGVHVRPAVDHRRRVEVEDPVALLRVGHVRHEVDLSRLEALESLVPGSGDPDQVPPFFLGDLLDEVDEDTGGLAVRLRERVDLGLVLIDPMRTERGSAAAGEVARREATTITAMETAQY